MAVYLWNWYPEIDGNGRVSVNGIRHGAIQKEPVKKLLGIFEQGMLLETMKGHSIALKYAGALDTRIPSYVALNYPEYRCRSGIGESIDLKLEADYRRGKLRPDSPLLFYLLCQIAWEPDQRERSKADSWPMRRRHNYAVAELMRARKGKRLNELRKKSKLLKIMRKQEMYLELGSGEPLFMGRVYWKNAAGAVLDETEGVHTALCGWKPRKL